MQREFIKPKIDPIKIQPLFKKKFSPVTSPIEALDSDLKPLAAVSVEPKNLDIKCLYNEKLEIIRDIVTYSSKYDTNYSIRARFKKILELSKRLENLVKVSNDQISSELQFHKKLKKSLKKANVITLSPQILNENSCPIQQTSIQVCISISGVHCIALISSREGTNEFGIDFYSGNDSLIHSYNLSYPMGTYPDTFEHVFIEKVLKKMHFYNLNGQMAVKYLEENENKEYLVVNLRGSRSEYCVTITQIDEKYFELSIFDYSIKVLGKELEINDLSELKTLEKKHFVKSCIESKLTLISNELAWGLSDWTIRKNLKKNKTWRDIKPNLLETEGDDDKYDILKVQGKVFVSRTELMIQFIYNTITQKTKIIVEINSKTIRIPQEAYEKEFKALKQLQKYRVWSFTILKSLEFSYFLKKLLFI
jgi:hypothetical protein